VAFRGLHVTRRGARLAGVRRGQSTVELVALLAAVAVVLLVAGRLVAAGGLPGDVAAAVRRALTHVRGRAHGDRAALASRSLGPLIRRYAPVLVLERDAYGLDASVPVDFRRCRTLSCAAYPAPATAFVHVLRRADTVYVEYWVYYPDSRTDHLPLAALAGYHRDDWEGAIVRLGHDGSATARVSAHEGFAGARSWWSSDPGWRPVAPHPVVYRAAGSHANGFGPSDIDLAGDRWNGTAGTVSRLALEPADEAPAARARFAAGAVPPWRKAVYGDPLLASTAADGTRGPLVRLAALWAALAGAA
jgi:hypothetical protein